MHKGSPSSQIMITNPEQPHQNPKLGVSALFTAKGKSGNSKSTKQFHEIEAINNKPDMESTRKHKQSITKTSKS
jgi:hypothetical protein